MPATPADLESGAPPSAVRQAVLVAVDGGATGTRVRLHGSGGALLAGAEAGASSLTLGLEQAWRNIGAAIREAAASADIDLARADLRIGLGLAGSRNPMRRADFRSADPFGADLVIFTDGYASLVGALDGEPGTVIAVGTGVAGHRLLPDGSVREAGGWGFPVGDEGGGAWMGHRAMQAYLKHLDGRRAIASLLFRRIEGHIGESLAQLQTWLLEASATEYAALAPHVVAAAAEGDPLANGILDAAAAEMMELLTALEPHGGHRTPLSLLGGLAPVLAPRLPETTRARLSPAKGTALDGALRVLLGRSPPEPLP